MIKIFEDSYDSPAAFKAALANPRAVEKYKSDYGAIDACDTFILLLPSGIDAHGEMIHARDLGKTIFILLSPPPMGPPEMLFMHSGLTFVDDIPDLIAHLRRHPTIHKVYVASSWRKSANHSTVIKALRCANYQTFDYRFPRSRETKLGAFVRVKHKQ